MDENNLSSSMRKKKFISIFILILLSWIGFYGFMAFSRGLFPPQWAYNNINSPTLKIPPNESFPDGVEYANPDYGRIPGIIREYIIIYIAGFFSGLINGYLVSLLPAKFPIIARSTLSLILGLISYFVTSILGAIFIWGL